MDPLLFKNNNKSKDAFFQRRDISKKTSGKDKYFEVIVVDVEYFTVSLMSMHDRKLFVKFPMLYRNVQKKRAVGHSKTIADFLLDGPIP